MTLLEEYDKKIKIVHLLRRQASGCLRHADELESEANQIGGIVHHTREPGFPCWLAGRRYYNTPREALAALEKEGKT
jgi:hypothetical protein